MSRGIIKIGFKILEEIIEIIIEKMKIKSMIK